MPSLELIYIESDLFEQFTHKAEKVLKEPSKEKFLLVFNDVLSLYKVDLRDLFEDRDLSKSENLARLLIRLIQKICNVEVFDESDLINLMWEYGDGDLTNPLIVNFFNKFPEIENAKGFTEFCKMTNADRGTFGTKFPFGTSLGYSVDDGVLSPEEVGELKHILPVLENYKIELPGDYTFTKQWAKLIEIIDSLSEPYPYIYMICYP